ncbi:unnamed protein product [Cyprideis torosa]|uniref:microtubule-severing ATPase n=1 Tax=Cyprideis torosa TaxID=163714 RepID=A0A7R8WEQ2_9CRUS|nr:unnamed protein product [Cyprideis torosa]CAG0896067.1 unnamed protein product [Cyprideis torosa]
MDPVLVKQKEYHRLAHVDLSAALKIDESRNERDVAEAIRLYKRGVERLRRALAIEIRGRGNEYDEARERQSKMKGSLEMVEDRIRCLETVNHLNSLEVNANNTNTRKQPQIPPRKNTAQTAVSNKKTAMVRPHSVTVAKRKPAVSPGPRIRPRSTGDVPPPAASGRGGQPPISSKVSTMKGIDKKLADVVLNELVDETPGVQFSDIGGQETAKQALHEMVILPALRPELFTGLRSPTRGLLLFGPPGNGKTMLAKAVATEAKARFFSISASSLTSKWFGEGEKLVRTLFAIATAVEPSIIFIDEVDTLLRARSNSDHDAMRRLETEFLVQFDGVRSSSECRVVVMAATNRPQELDEAVLRRFPKRVYLGLPDFQVRRSIVEVLLKKETGGLDGLSLRDLDDIAKRTEGYSCSDLTLLAKDAAMGPIRELNPEQIQRIDPKKIRPVFLQDFRNALQKIRGSVSVGHVKQLEKWRDQFGDISR